MAALAIATAGLASSSTLPLLALLRSVQGLLAASPPPVRHPPA
jgi:hypothetical protein